MNNENEIDPETLEALNTYDIKWIARDSNGDLFGYQNKPINEGHQWKSSSDYFGINNDLFPEVEETFCIEYNPEPRPQPKNEKIKIGIRQDPCSGRMIPYDVVSGREIVGVITLQINEEVRSASAAIIRTFLHNSDGEIVKT